MPTFRISPLTALAAVVVLLPAATNAWAQAPGPRILTKAGPKAGPKAVNKVARRAAELDRFDRMTPQQREKALDRLPPERRRRIEQGLAEYRAMDPVNRQRLRNFQQLPQEQRQAVRENFRRMQELPQPRRALVRKEVQQLRSMSDGERESRYQSEAFRKRFDPSEQSLIRDTVDNLPPPIVRPDPQ